MAEIKEILNNEMINAAFYAEKSMIFKNSTRCPISREARNRFEEFAVSCDEEIELYMVDVIAQKDFSNEITKRSDIVHQSPQVIFLKKGDVVWSKSHFEIKYEKLKEALL